MKYIKVYEGFWGDRYYWKVELEYLEMSLSKIKTPPLRMKDGKCVKAPKTLYKKIIDAVALSWGDDNNQIFINYNDGEWNWTATWNIDKLKDARYDYQGEIELEPHEKDAKKFNL